MKKFVLSHVNRVLILDKPLKAGKHFIKAVYTECPKKVCTTVYEVKPGGVRWKRET